MSPPAFGRAHRVHFIVRGRRFQRRAFDCLGQSAIESIRHDAVTPSRSAGFLRCATNGIHEDEALLTPWSRERMGSRKLLGGSMLLAPENWIKPLAKDTGRVLISKWRPSLFGDNSRSSSAFPMAAAGATLRAMSVPARKAVVPIGVLFFSLQERGDWANSVAQVSGCSFYKVH